MTPRHGGGSGTDPPRDDARSWGNRIRVADPLVALASVGSLGHPATPGRGGGSSLTPSAGGCTYGDALRPGMWVLAECGGPGCWPCFQEAGHPGAHPEMLRGARHALEIPVGTIGRTGTVPGDELTWTP